MSKIDKENWNYTFYQTDKLKAFISLGAEPTENTDECTFMYFLTVTNIDDQEVFQQKYTSLQDSLRNINDRYSSWTLASKSNKSDQSDGCSSCNAH